MSKKPKLSAKEALKLKKDQSYERFATSLGIYDYTRPLDPPRTVAEPILNRIDPKGIQTMMIQKDTDVIPKRFRKSRYKFEEPYFVARARNRSALEIKTAEPNDWVSIGPRLSPDERKSYVLPPLTIKPKRRFDRKKLDSSGMFQSLQSVPEKSLYSSINYLKKLEKNSHEASPPIKRVD